MFSQVWSDRVRALESPGQPESGSQSREAARSSPEAESVHFPLEQGGSARAQGPRLRANRAHVGPGEVAGLQKAHDVPLGCLSPSCPSCAQGKPL